MEGLARRTRDPKKREERQAEIALPKIPADAIPVWDKFWRIRRRVQNGPGLQPITWSDLRNFRDLTHTSINPFQMQVIEELDDLYLSTKPLNDGEDGDE